MSDILKICVQVKLFVLCGSSYVWQYVIIYFHINNLYIIYVYKVSNNIISTRWLLIKYMIQNTVCVVYSIYV